MSSTYVYYSGAVAALFLSIIAGSCYAADTSTLKDDCFLLCTLSPNSVKCFRCKNRLPMRFGKRSGTSADYSSVYDDNSKMSSKSEQPAESLPDARIVPLESQHANVIWSEDPTSHRDISEYFRLF